MTIKQEFILLCIYSDFARDQSKLIDVLERYNFKEKSELGQNLQPLLDNDYSVYLFSPLIFCSLNHEAYSSRIRCHEIEFIIFYFFLPHQCHHPLLHCYLLFSFNFLPFLKVQNQVN